MGPPRLLSADEKQLILKKVGFEDIGGYSDVKQLLLESVIWPIKYKEMYKSFGLSHPKGILLYGPPGCSKTLMARAVANESSMTFISVKGPELTDKWIGESERRIRRLFALARDKFPSIIFIDELDSIAKRISSTSHEYSSRVLDTFLTEMDGLEELNDVIVIGTTNRPSSIDPALMRPGRLDRHIEVGLPDFDARRKIFEIKTKNTKFDGIIDFEYLVERTKGFSGAEIACVCQEASMLALRRAILSGEDARVSRAELEEALDIVSGRKRS
jgi:transitional endoplasmic reticulum ATPase